MIDVGGAKHWQGELGKLAPQVIKVNGHHYERTEFGGPWKSFDPAQRAKEEQEAKQAYEKRIFDLKTATEWYSMTEDQRKDVGSKLFPTIATPEGGWTKEKAVEAGIFSKTALSRPESSASFFMSKGNIGNIVPKGVDAENQPIYAFQGKGIYESSSSSDPSGISKFSRLASSEGYFQENVELSDFLTGLGREAKMETTKATPKYIEDAKAKALNQKVEAAEIMPSGGGRSPLKRSLTSTQKNTLRIGGVADTDETSVNIPT
jgi:hypothetical protein